MKTVSLTLSHAYKGMREETKRQAEGKTTLLGVGWIFPHCHRADSSWRSNHQKEKNFMPKGFEKLGTVVRAQMGSASQSGEPPEAQGGQTGKQSENQNRVETPPGRLNAEHGNAHADPNGEEDHQAEQQDGGDAFEQFHRD
jgi:hypothetical protein